MKSTILQLKSPNMNLSFFTEKVLLIAIKTDFVYFWYLYSIFYYISFIFNTEFVELHECHHCNVCASAEKWGISNILGQVKTVNYCVHPNGLGLNTELSLMYCQFFSFHFCLSRLCLTYSIHGRIFEYLNTKSSLPMIRIKI